MSQPNLQRYTLDNLYLFPLYKGRASAIAAGLDPASYDSTKLTKSWVDLSDGPYNYSYIDGTMTRQTFSLTKLEAQSLNIFGTKPYPPYIPAPNSVLRGGLVSPYAMPATSLSSVEDARELAAAWKLSNPIIADLSVNSGPFADTFPPTETRRVWAIIYNGTILIVGEQINFSYAQGLGAPGHWDLSGHVPVWVSDVPLAAQTQNPEGPVPERALLSNETLMSGGILDPTIYVYRTDLGGGPQSGSPVSGGTPGLTSSQDARLTNIERLVIATAGKFGVV